MRLTVACPATPEIRVAKFKLARRPPTTDAYYCADDASPLPRGARRLSPFAQLGRRRLGRPASSGLPAGRVDRARLLPGDEARQAGARRGPSGRRQDGAGEVAGASTSGRELVRLQCYEGLDEAKALYEWNYRKQLLRIQAEASGTGWEAVQEDIFGEEFLLARPLMTAIASEQPVVLLIDEIDKTDQEFEAMLLEVLSDFQISIPELGRVESRTHPVVLLTSNNSRELTEALKRRCLYLWLDYPELEHELEIVRLHTPELRETVARRLVEVIGMVRDARPEEATVDRRVDRLGACAAAARRRGHRREDVHRNDVGDRQAPHRHGRGRRARRAEARLAGRRRLRAGVASPGNDPGRDALTPAPPGLPARILEFGEELRGEGVAVGTSELLDAFAVLARDRLDRARGLPRGARGDARQEPGGPARVRARVRALLLPRRRAGSRRARACARRTWRCSASSPRTSSTRCAPQIAAGAAGRLGGRDARPRADGDRGVRAPPGGLRRDRRRRAAHPPCARPARRAPAGAARGGPAPRRPAARRAAPLRGAAAPRARARADRAHGQPAAGAAARRARPRAALRAAGGPRRRAPRRRAAAPAPGDAGKRRCAATASTRTSTCAARCAPRCRPAACRSSSSSARADRNGRRSTCCATSRRASPRPRSSSSRCCTRCTTRSARCARSCSSSGSPRSRTSSNTSATSKPSASAIGSRRRRRRHLGLHRLRARVVGVPRAGRGRPAPARDRDRARRRTHQRARPARRHLRPDRRTRRAHVLAQPRAAPLLELRRLRDRGLRRVLHGVRVLDDRASSRTSCGR